MKIKAILKSILFTLVLLATSAIILGGLIALFYFYNWTFFVFLGIAGLLIICGISCLAYTLIFKD